MSFVLDHLAEHHAGLVDERKIAVVGHSLGGASASEAMLRDERGEAGVDIDGGDHGVSTDLPLLRQQAGILSGGAPLPGERGAEPSNEVVVAFVGTHLRGEEHPLLDGETQERPELLFWHLERPEPTR